ncbi:hypothetical protein PPMP20_03510 [Paraburkholderia phymatum]|uniref:Uncharacterized protein n=1 Tax=Paraburkholderia phymatum (strain DSM 17167 / CIP 108236 / LMG 21445 / STM815) TaxID=391038 RepID=B2JX28_PARP8|nr:hypothetical protein [Paraburkholderia phymatum]ACC75505.1 conserved hypothetical protein [Paraburkholderia phymatum STM815]
MTGASGAAVRGGARAFAWRGVAALTVLAAVSMSLPQAAHSADAASGANAADAPIAPAEKLMFLTPHLHGVASQTELDYALVVTVPPNKQTDRVRVFVASADNSKSDASVSDGSGKVQLPENLPCNPVILYFLERDIAEMEQATGGQRRYFQQRVRLALAASPPITDATVQLDGKAVKARKIVIQPYLHDPNAQRFPRFTSKRYTFLLADAVPGGVWLLRTDVPGDNDDFAHPLKTESLSYEGSLRKLQPPAQSKPPSPSATPNAPRASR